MFSDTNALITFLIEVGPTLIFILMLASGLLIGYFRGFRKSLVFLIHAAIAFTICFILFLTLANNHDFDAFIVSTINTFGGQGFIQRTLGVSTECVTFREMFYEFIPKQMSLVDGIALILKDNGDYLNALVDMAYRIVFALVLMILYNILIFIMWIIYLIFYNNKKYVNKYMMLYENGELDRKYEKRRISGMVITGLRRAFSGLIFLSFVGTAYYIISGDIGTEKQEDISFDDENVNLVYGAYSSISSYGTQGIFKILNLCRDSNDVPYYLFAADLVFQGSITNATTGVTQNVYFRDEIAQYIKFTKSTFNLLIKYDGDNIIEMVNEGSLNNNEIMNSLSKMFQNEEFVEEFDLIIDEFDANSYFINLGFSLMDSIMANIDDMEFMKGVNQNILEPLKIMFTDGYYSKVIPYEAKLYEESLKDNEMVYPLKTIKPSDLLTTDDIKTIFDILMVYLKNGTVNSTNATEAIMSIIPYLKNLSILSGERKEELDPVFKRLIAYVKYSYLGGDSSYSSVSDDFSEKFYISSSYDKVSWINELSIITDVANDVLDIYTNEFKGKTNILDSIISLYDKNDSNYYKYKASLEKLVNYLSSSYALAYVLSSTKVLDTIVSGLTTNLPNITFPQNISLGNTYDENGRLISNGELYYLIMGLDSLLSQDDTASVLKDIMAGSTTSDTEKLLNTLFSALNSKVNGVSVSESIVGSDILRSIFSSVLTNESLFNGFSIYIDDSLFEYDENGNKLNIIQKNELKLLFDNGMTLVDLASPIIKGESVTTDFYVDLLQNKEVLTILDSKIIEGTFSSLINNYLSTNEFVIIPQSFKDKEDYISTVSSDSEVKKIIKAVQETSLDLSLIINGASSESLKTDLTNMIINLSSDDLNKIINSKILHYSISNYIISNGNSMLGAISVVIPNDVCLQLENDTVDKVIKDTELIDFFSQVQKIFPSTGEIMAADLLALLCRNTDVMENEIISVTLAKAIADDASASQANKKLGDLTNVLEVPTKFDADHLGSATLLGENFTKANAWYYEASALVNALEEILQFKSNPDKQLSGNIDEITNEIMTIFKTLNEPHNKYTAETKLDYIYKSEIFVATLSKQINDSSLLDSLSDTVLDSIQDKEYKKGFFTFKKSEIKSLIDIINLYDISLTDADSMSNKIDEITNEIANNVLGIVDELTTDEKSKLNIDPSTSKTKLDVLYASAIVKEVLTNELDNVLLTNGLASLNALSLDENENFNGASNSLVKDKYGYYKEEEIKSLVNLLEILGYDINNSTEITEEALTNLLKPYEANPQISNLRYLYNQYITSIIIYNSIDGLSTNLSIDIPNDSKIYKNSTYYDALEYDESYALLVYASEIGISSLDVTKMDLDKIQAQIDVLSNSRIVSSIMYKVINSDVDGIVVPLDALDDSKKYIKLDEFKRFLSILTNSKEDIFESNGDGTYNLTSLKINKDSLDADTILTICEGESMIFTGTIVTVLVNNIDELDGLVIPYDYYKAGSKDAFESTKNNVWISSNELYNLAIGGKTLGIKLNSVSEEEINNINYTTLTDSDIDNIISSQILRATITYNIRINKSSTYITFSREYVYTLSKYDSTYGKENICSLSKEEVKHSIKAIQAVSEKTGTTNLTISFSFNDLKNFDNETISTLMASGIFRYQISKIINDYIESKPGVKAVVSVTTYGTKEDVINLNNPEDIINDYVMLTEAEAVSLLSTIASIPGEE